MPVKNSNSKISACPDLVTDLLIPSTFPSLIIIIIIIGIYILPFPFIKCSKALHIVIV